MSVLARCAMVVGCGCSEFRSACTILWPLEQQLGEIEAREHVAHGFHDQITAEHIDWLTARLREAITLVAELWEAAGQDDDARDERICKWLEG